MGTANKFTRKNAPRVEGIKVVDRKQWFLFKRISKLLFELFDILDSLLGEQFTNNIKED